MTRYAKNVREILRVSHVAPQEIAALALDAATHTAVLLGADDQAGAPGHLLDRCAGGPSDTAAAGRNGRGNHPGML